MNSYTYQQIEVGQEESFTVRISEEDMEMFATISGDLNPLHRDGEYAKQRGYNGRVVYGMLTSSYLSALAGMYLPGEHSLIHEVLVKLTKPCYIGDELTFSAVCDEKQDTFQRITLKIRVTRISSSGQDTVLRGTMKVGVAE